MRAASFLAATVIAIGAYLAVASIIGMSPSWIGLGILAIAVVASVTLVAVQAPEQN